MSQTAFLFPGQGAQSVGMCQELCESFQPAQTLFEQASNVLGYDLAELCVSGPKEKLDETRHSQPALYVASIAALEKLKADDSDRVAQCALTAGLSLGEYTALYFAGVLDFESGLRLVQERGEAMQAASEAIPSGMVSLLGGDVAGAETLCDANRGDGVLQVANKLCPGNTVVSGDMEACDRIAEAAGDAGMKSVKLAVAGAFHTSIMQPAVERLTAALANTNLNSARIPVVSNVDGLAHTDPEEIKDLLVKQIVSPVLWEDSIRSLLASGVDQFTEIGPGRVLKGLMKRIDRKVACDNVTC